MKKTFRILCGFVCMLTLVALVLSSCNSGGASQNTTPTDVTTENNSPTVITPEETTAPSEDTEPTKQVPVYQGMSISTSLGKPMVSFARRGVAPVKYEKQGNTENNGNHYGWYKGDSADEKGDVDQNTPFPDADENIEQEIKDSLKVVGSGQEIYYATQNQDIYIHIHIHNPDQFEILSFTLNGQKYSSYMFEAGSTQELLILKLNVGNASGIVDYTIDQIKYIDGTEIKDVMIDGNKTVKAGIRTENQVSANVSNLQIGTNSVFFNATIADKDDLIAFSNGVIKAVLYDGSVLLSEKELAVGTNEVVFEGLKNGTVYQYAIVACYDNLTGDAIDFHLLTKEAFQTNNIVLFDNIVVGQDSINFTFKWDESVTNKALNSLKLYKNGELVTTLEANATTATDLFSASEYVLLAEYQDLGQPATISLTFATLEKGVPGISIINPTQTQTSVGFEIVETDTDNVGAITKIELVHENGTVVADNIDVRNFANLLSNTAYTVKVTYTYDLNDGNGAQTITKEKEIVTFAKAVPEISIINLAQTQTSVGFEIVETDTDNVGVITKIELVHANGTVSATSLDQRAFADLLSNNEYTIKVTYVYNLNDGVGDKTVTKEATVKTDAKATPEISITNPAQTQTSVGFEIVETDTDNVGVITKIELVHANGTVSATSLDQRAFADLLSNNKYTVKVTYVYNLNDGTGDKTVVKELPVTTLAKAAPDITIANTAKGQESLTFSVSVTDTDAVGAITKVELIRGTEITTLANVTTHEIENLLSNNEYTIKVTYTYNLNDGSGAQTLTKELTAKTDAKATPEISILNPTQTQTSVGFEIVEIDVDDVGEITKIELVHANGIVSATSLNQRTFADLLSNNAYTVKLTYVYNLNDGTGNTTVVKELAITTIAKNAPSFEVKNENVTTDSISAEYDVTDVDNILASYKVELYQGTTLVLENTEKAISFASLNYYTDYTLKISYTYNLNDGKGEQASVFEKSYKTLPFIDVLECNVANTSAVSEGETIFMSVKLNNPLGMTVESVVINGETYGVTGASTKNKIFVEIVYNGQFAGGDTYLKVDKVNAKLESTTLTIEPQTELSDNVFINGKLEVLKIDFVNEDFEPIDWAFPSDTVYVMIALNNPTGYNIDCVNGNITDLIKLDDNYWYYDATDYLHNGWCGSTLDSLGYSNNHISKIVSYSDMHIWCYLTTTNETIYIRNANDLKNMSSGCYYELANDIDLNGIEWDGECFEGVFDGKGYAIKNISFVGNIKNSNAYLGLFDSGSGVIQNLNIEEATIIADVTTSDEGEYVLYCGGLIAYSTLTKINNCKIDETSVINIKTNSGTSYVGSLIGYVAPANDVFLSNCINSCSISLKSNNRQASIYAGGLIGGVNNTGYVLYSNYLINIINCLNSGDISAYYEDVEGYQCGAGALIGIAGMLNDSSKLIVNSFGSLNTGNTNYRFIGVSNYDHSVFIDTYSLLSIDQGMLCTIEQLNSKHFYTEILGWSADVWDFSELDVANGKYPKLK